MTQSVSGYLPNLLGPVALTQNGGSPVTARPTLNFIGATLTDDAANNRTNITGTATWATLGTGTQSLPAVTSFVTTSSAKCTVKTREPVHVTTTSLTTTTLDSFTLANGCTTVTWLVTATKSDMTQCGTWQVSATYRNNAGAIAILGSVVVTAIGTPDDAAWVPTADFSAGVARLRVPGKAAITVQWGASGTTQNTGP